MPNTLKDLSVVSKCYMVEVNDSSPNGDFFFRLLLLSSCLNKLPVGSVLGCHLSSVQTLPNHCKIIKIFILSLPTKRDINLTVTGRV